MYRYRINTIHNRKVKRYFWWLIYCYFSALVVFLVPWLSLNGLVSPFKSGGLEIIGGIINNQGFTGDFNSSAIASFIILLNIYHLIIIIGTRHFSNSIMASFIISFIIYLVAAILDNNECIQQTNLPFIFGSFALPLSIIVASTMVALPVYAVKTWEMVLYGPEFY